MSKKKKFGVKQIAMIAIALLAAGIGLSYAGYGNLAQIGAGLLLLAIAFTDVGKENFGVTKDMHKWGLAIFGGLMLVNVAVVSGPFNNIVAQGVGVLGNVGASTGDLGDTGTGDTGTGAVDTGSGNQNTGGNLPTANIITTTAQMSVNARNLLNKSDDQLNPSGYYLYGGAYRSLSFSSGVATISSLDPNAVIEKMSAGTDGTFYWTQQSNIPLNGQLSPAVTMYLVRVPSSTTMRLYDSTFARIDSGLTNTTVGAGGVLRGKVKFSVDSIYTGLRAPVFAFEVNTTAVSDVVMAGKNTVGCPSSIIVPTNERSLFRCYDSGYDWIVDSASKPGLQNAVYGEKDYDFETQFKSAVNPTNIAGHATVVYIIDRDEYFRAAPGALFFLDPDTTNTDLGYNSEPTATAFVA